MSWCRCRSTPSASNPTTDPSPTRLPCAPHTRKVWGVPQCAWRRRDSTPSGPPGRPSCALATPPPASSPYHSCISPPFRSVAHCRSRCGAMPVYHKLTQRCAFHPATPARHTQPPTAPCHAQPSVFVLIPPFSSRVSLPRSPNRRHDCGLAPGSPPRGRARPLVVGGGLGDVCDV